jgi:hypothetical protein
MAMGAAVSEVARRVSGDLVSLYSGRSPIVARCPDKPKWLEDRFLIGMFGVFVRCHQRIVLHHECSD